MFYRHSNIITVPDEAGRIIITNESVCGLHGQCIFLLYIKSTRKFLSPGPLSYL